MGPNAIVVVFVMRGCDACHAYLPKLKAAARQHPRVPLHIFQADAPQGSQAWQVAERYGVSATPTTLVLRRGPGSIKTIGDLDPGQIEYLFTVAERA